MTWMTPFEQAMSVYTIFALSMETPSAPAEIFASAPWRVLAEESLAASDAMTLPLTT